MLEVSLKAMVEDKKHQGFSGFGGSTAARPFWSLTGQQAGLCMLFGLLLISVVLGCTLSPSPFVAVGLVIGFAVCIGAMLYPHFAILITFACAGMPSLLLYLPGHTAHLIEPPLVLCILIILLRRPDLRLRLPHLLALGFVAISVISFIHVPEIATNAYSADKRLLTLIVIFVAFFCGTFLARYIKNTSSFLVAILLTNIPLYLISLAQFLGVHLPSFLEADGAQDLTIAQGRLWGPFSWSSTFAIYLINLFAIALSCWILGTRLRYRLVGMVMTIATALAIIGSGTRSVAIVACGLTIATLLITRRFKTLLITVSLLTVASVFSLGTLLPRFLHDPSSVANRFLLWNEASKLIISHPWIGVGLQQFRFYYAQLIVSRTAQLNARGVVPHQQYLEWGVESGILALVIGVLLLCSTALFCWRAYRVDDSDRRALLLAALLAMVANILIGFLDVPLDPVEGSVFLFLLAGLALGCAEHKHWISLAKRFSLVPLFDLQRRAVMCDGLVGGQIASSPAPLQLSPSAPNMQKTGRSVLIQLLFWGITVPMIFPMTALLTRYLGPTRYGEYSLTFPFFTIFALLSGTGMDPLIIRDLSLQPRSKWSDILSYAAGTRLVSSILSAGVAAIVAWVLPISAEQRSLFLVGSSTLLFSFSFNGLRIIYSHGFRAEQRVGALSLLEMVNRLITAGLVLLVVLLRLPLFWGYVLLMYSDVPMFLFQVWLAHRRFGVRLRFSPSRFREHMLGGLPLMGHNALTLLCGQLDILLLMVMIGPLEVGIFALASRVIDPLISIAIAYVNGLYPLLCRRFEAGRESFAGVFHETTRILALVIFPLALLICVEARSIVALLGGQQFATATIAVQLLMGAMVATFFNQLCERACMAAHLERRIPFVTVTTAIVNLVANLIFIPRWQIAGAGIASIMSELVGLCLFIVLLRCHINLWPTMSMVLLTLVSNLPALIFLLWQEQTTLLLTIPIALLLTIATYLAVRTLSLKDFVVIGHFLPGYRRPVVDYSPSHATVIATAQDISTCPTFILPRVQV
ncbi:MAG TPA: oligosaccharide flippase family protein [Ktedonobacteraceae bacterium]|nr:oligosaccharide flippase family protein [Ktedonobacteraceae bacterium]